MTEYTLRGHAIAVIERERTQYCKDYATSATRLAEMVLTCLESLDTLYEYCTITGSNVVLTPDGKDLKFVPAPKKKPRKGAKRGRK